MKKETLEEKEERKLKWKKKQEEIELIDKDNQKIFLRSLFKFINKSNLIKFLKMIINDRIKYNIKILLFYKDLLERLERLEKISLTKITEEFIKIILDNNDIKYYYDLYTSYITKNLNKLLTKKLIESDLDYKNINKINLKKYIHSIHLYNIKYNINNVNNLFLEQYKLYKIIKNKKIDKKNSIIVCPGSSADKVGFLLELNGYDVKYLPFSRSYFINRGMSRYSKNNLSLINTKYKDLYYKNLCKKHYLKILEENGLTKENVKNKKIVIIDYLSTGISLLFLNKLLISCLDINKTDIDIYACKDHNDKERNTNLDIILPSKLHLIDSPPGFWYFSKYNRCIPELINPRYKSYRGDRKLPQYSLNHCNLIRLWLYLEYSKHHNI
jgi:hypothetical protein